MKTNGSKAILFLNLGGPERPADVKPFLYRLFEDPEVLRIRFTPLRKLVAWLIATLREKKSQSLYATIGGGSPIRRLTDEQSSAVEKILTGEGRHVRVRTAFTCSAPLVEDVVKELAGSGVKEFLSFPLYPQYSLTTTKGSLERVRKAVARLAPGARVSEIMSWPTHPLFLEAHADQVRRAAATFPRAQDENIHLLFSAHSIPEKLVTKEGDPYRDEMEESAEGVVRKAGWKGPWSLAWQSKLGPVKWLGPSTSNVIKELGGKGVTQLLIVPIAFVTDHIETLNEIDLQFSDEAREAGITEFRRTPGLNNHPVFLRALAELAKAQPEFWS